MRFRVGRFVGDESGTTTIELTIWSPLIAGALMLALDFSYLMTMNASMWNASRSTARALSMHELTEAEARSFLQEALFFKDRPYQVDIRQSARDVEVSVKLPGDKAALTPFLPRFYKGEVGASVRMFREPV